jgi:hypothetical protein
MTSQAPTQGPTDAGLTARVLSSEWQPIETAPLNERVIVWRQRIQGPCVAFVQAGISASGFDAIEPESGKLFRAEWWMPLDTFPTPPTNPKGAA